MKLEKFGHTFIFAVIVVSFTIPDNTTNGVYAVMALDNGSEEHVRVGDLPSEEQIKDLKAHLASSPVAIRASNRRGGIWPYTGWYEPNCYPEELDGTEDLDHGATDAANAALDVQQGSVGSQLAFYSISGCVVAYACNFDYMSWDFSSLEHHYACRAITKKCGSYKPGSIDCVGLPGLHILKSYGYEAYCSARGHNYCGHGV